MKPLVLCPLSPVYHSDKNAMLYYKARPFTDLGLLGTSAHQRKSLFLSMPAQGR